MRHWRIALVVAAFLILTIVGSAAAGIKAGRDTWFSTITSVYGSCTGDFSTWRGDEGKMLVLNHNCLDPNKSVDATIAVSPKCSGDNELLSCYFAAGGLTALGFDHKISTYCQGGSPGWDVEAPGTSGDDVWRFACSGGTHTALPGRPGWERISFSVADAQQLAGVDAFTFNGSIKPFFMQVLQDEVGCTMLDNLRINAVVITHGRPGSEAHC